MSELKPRPEGYPIKLVRDRTPDILNGSGEPGDLFYGPCPPAERRRWLRLKLAEEVAEYLVDGGDDELADVYAVLIALADDHGLDLSEQDHERGGFHAAVMMFGRHPEFRPGHQAVNRSFPLSRSSALGRKGGTLKRSGKLRPGKRKPRPSLQGFHEAVIARAGGRCELGSSYCYGRLWGHHYVAKAGLKDNPEAYVDPRNGVALCIHHHAQVENARVVCPRPPELDEFLEDYNIIERRAA